MLKMPKDAKCPLDLIKGEVTKESIKQAWEKLGFKDDLEKLYYMINNCKYIHNCFDQPVSPVIRPIIANICQTLGISKDAYKEFTDLWFSTGNSGRFNDWDIASLSCKGTACNCVCEKFKFSDEAMLSNNKFVEEDLSEALMLNLAKMTLGVEE